MNLVISAAIFEDLHKYQSSSFAHLGGENWFMIQSILIALAICKWGIPLSTDIMVNASAGLAGKYFGPKSRTLVINASTNNPEAANMLVSIGMARAGGIANPLGSNFANIYLMYLIAPIWLLLKWSISGQTSKAGQLIALLYKEKKLVFSHILMATLMFGFSSIAYWCMTGYSQFSPSSESSQLQPVTMLLIGAGISIVGIFLYFIWDRRLQNSRPELFEDIEDEGHEASWKMFFTGVGGLIAVSLLLNALFLSWSSIYSVALSGILGAAVFAGLHYFAGALVTSLPELKVAVDNYEKLSSPDLNTALASASASNMTNLAIAIIGVLIISAASYVGVIFVL